MSEIFVLNFFLFITFILGPLTSKFFFLNNSKIYPNGHKLCLMVILMATLLNLKFAFLIWPLFCIWGFALYLRNEYKSTFSIKGIAMCIPFIFSLISSVWFVGGIFDLHLLGYNKEWSFYAALHGSFIGWIFVGCLAYLAKQTNTSKIYVRGCYLSFLFFLCVAYGIDGVPYIKRIGVLGFSFLVPIIIGFYAFSLKKENKYSIFLSRLSLFSILVSMTLAVLNEFWFQFPKIIFAIPIMVLSHGLINALFAVPCFFLAIKFEK